MGVSILAILVSNRVWFLHSSLVVGMFLRRSYVPFPVADPDLELRVCVCVCV